MHEHMQTHVRGLYRHTTALASATANTLNLLPEPIRTKFECNTIGWAEQA